MHGWPVRQFTFPLLLRCEVPLGIDANRERFTVGRRLLSGSFEGRGRIPTEINLGPLAGRRGRVAHEKCFATGRRDRDAEAFRDRITIAQSVNGSAGFCVSDRAVG